jgi:hypothetical protein
VDIFTGHGNYKKLPSLRLFALGLSGCRNKKKTASGGSNGPGSMAWPRRLMCVHGPNVNIRSVWANLSYALDPTPASSVSLILGAGWGKMQ